MAGLAPAGFIRMNVLVTERRCQSPLREVRGVGVLRGVARGAHSWLPPSCVVSLQVSGR